MNVLRWMFGMKRKPSQLDLILEREAQIMALGQDILDKVTAVDTKVGSFIALIEALIADSTIPADVGAAILAALAGTEQELDDAIAAHTTPPPPPTP